MEGSYNKIGDWKVYRLLLRMYQCDCWEDTWWRPKEKSTYWKWNSGSSFQRQNCSYQCFFVQWTCTWDLCYLVKYSWWLEIKIWLTQEQTGRYPTSPLGLVVLWRALYCQTGKLNWNRNSSLTGVTQSRVVQQFFLMLAILKGFILSKWKTKL